MVPGQKRKVVLNKTVKNDLIKYQHRALFFEGSFVWAKMRGYKTWPAKILKMLPRGYFEVEFYGTSELGLVSLSNLYQYCSNTVEIFAIVDGREKLATQFKKALTDIEV